MADATTMVGSEVRACAVQVSGGEGARKGEANKNPQGEDLSSKYITLRHTEPKRPRRLRIGVSVLVCMSALLVFIDDYVHYLSNINQDVKVLTKF